VHLLDAPARLRLMGLLYRHRDVAARDARRRLDLTDGNLASHANRLEETGWLRSRRALAPQGFEVRYTITPDGSAAFRAHLARLREELEAWEGSGVPTAPRPGPSEQRSTPKSRGEGSLTNGSGP
jgi:DNA-binding MarR family transcriptional regulator